MKSYAGCWQRVKAFALDYVVIVGYVIAITLLFLILDHSSAVIQELFADRFQAQFVAFLLVTLPVALYFTISESSVRQATWGKQRMILKVIDYNGARISFWRSLARTFLKFLPWELSHTLIWEIYFSPHIDSLVINYGFGLVYVLIGLNVAGLVMTKTHQALYDFLAGTFVIKNSL